MLMNQLVTVVPLFLNLMNKPFSGYPSCRRVCLMKRIFPGAAHAECENADRPTSRYTSLPGYYLLVRAKSTLASFVKSRRNI